MNSQTFSLEQISALKSRQERMIQTLAERLREKSFSIEGNLWETPQLQFRDQGVALRHFLKQENRYTLLDQFPLNPSISATYTTKGFLSPKKTIGVIHSSTWISWNTLLSSSETPHLMPSEEIAQQIALFISSAPVLNIISLYHPNGFSAEALRLQEGIQNRTPYQLYFIQDAPSQAYSITGKSSGFRALFDPETPAEKQQRLQKNLTQHKKLAVRGNYLSLAELEKEWGIPEIQLLPLLKEIVPHCEGIRLEYLQETYIIKRSLR